MTSRFGRLVLAVAATLAVVMLAPVIALAGSLVNVDCGDGAPLSTTADLTTLTSLQASIQGMVDNPSGMSCSLTQGGVADPTLLGISTSNGGGDRFVVGGGRYGREFPNCPTNFSLNAHVNGQGPHGTQNVTMTNSDKGCPGQGHIRANVTCLAVNGLCSRPLLACSWRSSHRWQRSPTTWSPSIAGMARRYPPPRTLRH